MTYRQFFQRRVYGGVVSMIAGLVFAGLAGSRYPELNTIWISASIGVVLLSSCYFLLLRCPNCGRPVTSGRYWFGKGRLIVPRRCIKCSFDFDDEKVETGK